MRRALHDTPLTCAFPVVPDGSRRRPYFAHLVGSGGRGPSPDGRRIGRYRVIEPSTRTRRNLGGTGDGAGAVGARPALLLRLVLRAAGHPRGRRTVDLLMPLPRHHVQIAAPVAAGVAADHPGRGQLLQITGDMRGSVLGTQRPQPACDDRRMVTETPGVVRQGEQTEERQRRGHRALRKRLRLERLRLDRPDPRHQAPPRAAARSQVRVRASVSPGGAHRRPDGGPSPFCAGQAAWNTLLCSEDRAGVPRRKGRCGGWGDARSTCGRSVTSALASGSWCSRAPSLYPGRLSGPCPLRVLQRDSLS